MDGPRAVAAVQPWPAAAGTDGTAGAARSDISFNHADFFYIFPLDFRAPRRALMGWRMDEASDAGMDRSQVACGVRTGHYSCQQRDERARTGWPVDPHRCLCVNLHLELWGGEGGFPVGHLFWFVTEFLLHGLWVENMIYENNKVQRVLMNEKKKMFKR